MSEVQDTQFSTAQQLINTVNQKIENRDELTMSELKMICPEIATPEINPALRRKLGITDRYVHVPTEKVIEDIIELGWTPINAYRVASRGKRTGTGRHMVKFVKSQDFGSMKVRHYGYDFETIKGAVNSLVEQIPDYLKQVEDMKEQELEREQMLEFARQAALLRFKTANIETIDKVVDVEDLLESTRKEDNGNGLWEVFNHLQEKVVNGKFNYALGKKERKARPVKGFKPQVKLNQDLWELASSYLPETAAA